MKDHEFSNAQKMKNSENNANKYWKHSASKIQRKSLLGSCTLAVFLQPTSSSCHVSSNNCDQNDPESKSSFSKSQNKEPSAFNIFMMLKHANKVIVKGAKLYESLNELKLCGWINPYTLLLIGPSEDMKVLKHAWVKRHLKNPKGYFIKDVGMYYYHILYLNWIHGMCR